MSSRFVRTAKTGDCYYYPVLGLTIKGKKELETSRSNRCSCRLLDVNCSGRYYLLSRPKSQPEWACLNPSLQKQHLADNTGVAGFHSDKIHTCSYLNATLVTAIPGDCVRARFSQA